MGQVPAHPDHTHNATDERVSHYEPCMDTRFWPIFLALSLGCFFGGIVIILVYRTAVQLISKICACTNRQDVQEANTPDRGRSSACQGRWVCSQSSINTNIPVGETNMDLRTQGSLASMSPSTMAASSPNIAHRVNIACRSILQLVHKCALRLVSYQWRAGRVFIALSMIMSLCSFGIYVYEATFYPRDIEKCGHKGRRMRALDFAMNVFFLIHFLVRLIAARDALLFWIEWYSILDYLTVPPTLFGFFIKRSWLGLRFLRVFRLINLGEVLHNLHIVRSASSLRMCQLCTFFLSIWLSGAGMFLLLENTGDIVGRNAYHVTDPITYPSAMYFTIVTMSTVGYGDITPVTFLGKCFVCLFILFALATFASAIPEIAETFLTVRKYSGSYAKQEGKSHIVVCGDITTDSVRTFLSDFLHEDRQRSDVEVVFINPQSPDLQLQSILRLHFSRVKYFQGTVMDHGDLQRVRMVEADACLILASSTAADSYQKDAANIMRVIAVKNYASHVRVIVQLLHTENKAHLLNSPYWNWEQGDEIICFSELKLGFLAQSCVAPGFSTLLTNLFSMCSQQSVRKLGKRANAQIAGRRSWNSGQTKPLSPPIRPTSDTHFADSKRAGTRNRSPIASALRFVRNIFQKRDVRDLLERERYVPTVRVTPGTGNTAEPYLRPDFVASTVSIQRIPSQPQPEDSWLTDYLRGISMEIYSAVFSSSFEGLNFAEAAVICRQRLDLLLVAVVARTSSTKIVAQDNLGERLRSDVTKDSTSAVHSGGDEEAGIRCTEETSQPVETGYYLAINPYKDANVCIDQHTVGFFICESQSNASRVTVYCAHCHGTDSNDPTTVVPCPCERKPRTAREKLKRNTQRLFGRNQTSGLLTPSADGWEGVVVDLQPMGPVETAQERQTQAQLTTSGEHRHFEPEKQDDELHKTHLTPEPECGLDITGMYHYCETRSFESSLLRGTKRNALRNRLFVNHILLCLLANEDQPLIGLHSFVMPLRASHFHRDELKPIIILGNRTYLSREWASIANFPDVYCMPGSPLSRADLRTARIRFASVCVILASRGELQQDDPYMLDKEVILCSLNIRGMRFPPVTSKALQGKAPNRRVGSEIPLITELLTDANIHYLDPEDLDTGATDIPASLTAPFARGIAFTSSVLDVLASTAYFDCNAMTLIRHLITGGVTPALEQWLAEGGGLHCNERYEDVDTTNVNNVSVAADVHNEEGSEIHRHKSQSICYLPQSGSDSTFMEVRQRPHVAQLSVLDSRLRPYVTTENYIFPNFGALFCHAIKERGILCLGIYRSTHSAGNSMDEGRKLLKMSSVDESLLMNDRNWLLAPKPLKERRLSTCSKSIENAIHDYSVRLQREMSMVHTNPLVSGGTPQAGGISETAINRYVITNPPNDFPLKQSDLIFCLCPFEQHATNEE